MSKNNFMCHSYLQCTIIPQFHKKDVHIPTKTLAIFDLF